MFTTRTDQTTSGIHRALGAKAARAVLVAAAAGVLAASLAGPAFAQAAAPATRAALTRATEPLGKKHGGSQASLGKKHGGSQATASAMASLPRVTSVAFTGASGGTTAPTLTVTGTGFGARPPGQPDHACGGGYTGDYYGPNFYFWDDTPYWETGLIGDCIGLDVSSWTSHQIVFSFGSAYGQPGYTMHNGDNYALKIRSFMWGGTVNGLS